MSVPLVALAALVAAGGETEAGARRRVLYFSQTVGHSHATIPLGRKIIAALGAKSGAFDLDECTDCRKWSPDYFAPYDAMVSFGYGALPLAEANRKALLEFVRGGKGFVGIHAAVQMRPQPRWPAYTEMLGGAYLNTLWQQQVRITVEDRLHPATRHLGVCFRMSDEIYQFGPWSRVKTHVVLSIDNRSVDVFQGNVRRKDRDFAIAWCHPYGKGRVFYTALGHSVKVWNDPRFQTHIFNAIRWATGELEAKVRLGTDGRIHEVMAPTSPKTAAMAPGRSSFHDPRSPRGGYKSSCYRPFDDLRMLSSLGERR